MTPEVTLVPPFTTIPTCRPAEQAADCAVTLPAVLALVQAYHPAEGDTLAS